MKQEAVQLIKTFGTVKKEAGREENLTNFKKKSIFTSEKKKLIILHVAKVIPEQELLAVVFILAKTYLSLNIQLPSDITIENQTFDDFVKVYQKKLKNITTELIKIFSRTLVKIIDDCAEMALGTIINKPIQPNQTFELAIVLSGLPVVPALIFYSNYFFLHKPRFD